LPISGVLELEIGNTTDCVTHHSAAFIHPGETHCFASYSENEFLVLDAGIEHGWMRKIDIPTFWTLTPALQHYLQFAKAYLVQQIDNDLSKVFVRDFLLKLLAQHFLSSFDMRVQLAKDWIDVHFAEPIDIKKVAQVSCLSNSQLQRRFQRALGQSVGEYWRSVRMKQAQFLLKTESGNIEQIAFRVGYKSLATFSRSFSFTYGLSPSQWQNAAISKKNASQG
jgi:AraC-like DNA-binding protein